MYAQLGQNMKFKDEADPMAHLEISEDMLRHMVLNSIRMFRQKFKADYPELIIACDGQRSWRRDVYKEYKHRRKAEKSTSQLNWNAIFEAMTKIRHELEEYFPYRVIYVNEAEADDIIAVICKMHDHFPAHDEVLILSADKDFIQLQDQMNVKQFDPIRKKDVKNENPKLYLLHHILQGDSGDGVPNVLSADDCFVVEGGRQKALTGKIRNNIIETLKRDPAELDKEIFARFKRNNTLINLKMIPTHIQEKILAVYEQQSNKSIPVPLINYFMDKKLKLLTEHIGEF
jgi:hypothetical protein